MPGGAGRPRRAGGGGGGTGRGRQGGQGPGDESRGARAVSGRRPDPEHPSPPQAFVHAAQVPAAAFAVLILAFRLHRRLHGRREVSQPAPGTGPNPPEHASRRPEVRPSGRGQGALQPTAALSRPAGAAEPEVGASAPGVSLPFTTSRARRRARDAQRTASGAGAAGACALPRASAWSVRAAGALPRTSPGSGVRACDPAAARLPPPCFVHAGAAFRPVARSRRGTPGDGAGDTGSVVTTSPSGPARTATSSETPLST